MHSTKSSATRFALLSVIITAVLFAPVRAFAEDGVAALKQTSRAFSQAAKKALPAVVSVKVTKTIKSATPYSSPFDDEFFQRFFGPGYQRPQAQPQPRQQVGQGSGFIISEDGYILTNNHVVGGADEILVKLQDGRQTKGKIIGTDPKSDVALIKIEEKNLPVIELGDSDALEIGEWVIAVGSPFGLQATVTVGIVSAKSRGVGIAEYEDFIQTDAAINPGNSGGPLLNIDGKAIGLNTAIFSQSGGYMGIGFAIPINMAKSIKDQLLKSGKVTRGYLGIVMNPEKISAELAQEFGLNDSKGVLITQVIEESPAGKAGLKRGDVIVKLDGKEVDDWQAFRNSVAMIEPGTKVSLTVLRDGKKEDIDVKVGSLEDGTVAAEVSEIGDKLGLQIQELTDDVASKLGYEKETGVLVTDVTAGSPADKAGIESGMLIVSVNRRDVTTVKEFNDALEKTKTTRKALLLIRNERYAQYVVLSIE
jgi:serine protease Do